MAVAVSVGVCAVMLYRLAHRTLGSAFLAACINGIAVVNFVQKELSLHNFLSFRSDFLDDKKGQRTGYATRYSENSISWTHWMGTTVQIRPELRFERAWDRKAYDYGRRQNQLTVASDLIFHF